MTTWSAEERETVVTVSDADDVVNVWTAQRSVITRLRRDAAFTETASGDGWATFTIPADLWSPVGVKRKRSLTPEAKEAQRARFALISRQGNGESQTNPRSGTAGPNASDTRSILDTVTSA